MSRLLDFLGEEGWPEWGKRVSRLLDFLGEEGLAS